MLFRVFIGAVILASGSVEATATTTAESAPHAYDAPTISRVGVEALGTDAAASALLGGEGDQSSSLSVVGSGTSTTPTHSLNATKWVDDAGNIRWPGNRGFAGTPVDYVLDVGTRGVGVSPVA